MKKILVTRKLLDSNEEKLKKLYDAKLNSNDELYSQKKLIEMSKGCDGVLSALTDKLDKETINLLPDSVKILVSNGHEVLVENNGGFEAGFYNEQYKSAGAKIVDKAEDIFNDSEIIVKVKEPQSSEVKMIKENQIVFTYLHLAAAKELTKGLVDSKSVCIAYETVTDNNGRLPLLAPMSAVAGRMSVQAGAHCLEKNQKGRGLLLGGAPGVDPGNVVILGGGVVGENAAIIATGMKAKVHIVDKSEKRLDELSKKFGDLIIPKLSDETDLEKLILEIKNYLEILNNRKILLNVIKKELK